MQIKQLDLYGVDIRLEDGKAWQGLDPLLILENVESVTGYENLQSLTHLRSSCRNVTMALELHIPGYSFTPKLKNTLMQLLKYS